MECQNQYTLHNFADSPLNIYRTQTQTQTAVHSRQITLISHHCITPLPPAGIFDWQYVQCVLKKFGSQTYSDLGNIAFFAFSFRTQEDDDEDDSNGLGDEDDEQITEHPPYPSYHWDLAWQRQSEHLEAEERNHRIIIWGSGITV